MTRVMDGLTAAAGPLSGASVYMHISTHVHHSALACLPVPAHTCMPVQMAARGPHPCLASACDLSLHASDLSLHAGPFTPGPWRSHPSHPRASCSQLAATLAQSHSRPPPCSMDPCSLDPSSLDPSSPQALGHLLARVANLLSAV